MKNKYYAPELSEFCVGFEYQRYMERDFDEGSCIWEDKIFPEEGLCTGTIEYPNIVEIFYENYLEGVRVKYLDQQDIEDCGFIFKEYDKYRNVDVFIRTKELGINQLETTKISLFKDAPGQLLLEYSTSTGYEEQSIYKHMKIKNKTEFKKLLTQLGIK